MDDESSWYIKGPKRHQLFYVHYERKYVDLLIVYLSIYILMLNTTFPLFDLSYFLSLSFPSLHSPSRFLYVPSPHRRYSSTVNSTLTSYISFVSTFLSPSGSLFWLERKSSKVLTFWSYRPLSSVYPLTLCSSNLYSVLGLTRPGT